MNVAEALATSLKEWDCRYVFGVSGANIEHFHDAIHRLGEGRLKSVMARSEVGAAFMADSRARVHRTLGVCCATSGGGMMNLAVGIAESFAESVPVLAVVGQPPTVLEGRGAFQDSSGVGRTVNAVQMWSAIAKHVVRIESGESFWSDLRRAIDAAMSGRKGPAVLLVPRDVWTQEVGERPARWSTNLDDFVRTPAPQMHEVARLMSRIKHAKNPVLIMGTGVLRSKDQGDVAYFAKAVGLPVVSTMACTGIFPNNDPLYLGCVGVAGHPSAHQYLNEKADLIVAVGTGLDIMVRGPLNKAMMRASIAVVNTDPGPIERTLEPSQVLRADAGETFRLLRQLLRIQPFYHGRPAGYQITQVEPVLLKEEDHELVAKGDVLLQSEALKQLQPHLPVGGHILFDAGNCAATALHNLQFPSETSTTIALGMGGMGYAIPGAIGAQLGESSSKGTMVFCGDGAFLMLGLEVHTAVELGLRILFVVFNNNAHGMCVTRQKLLFEGREECSNYGQLNVATLSQGLGHADELWTGSASTPGELQMMLKHYAKWDGGPGVLELKIPVEEMPPFTPFLDGDARTVAADWRVTGAPSGTWARRDQSAA